MVRHRSVVEAAFVIFGHFFDSFGHFFGSQGSLTAFHEGGRAVYDTIDNHRRRFGPAA